jgi:hypothetical protein
MTWNDSSKLEGCCLVRYVLLSQRIVSSPKNHLNEASIVVGVHAGPTHEGDPVITRQSLYNKNIKLREYGAVDKKTIC